MAENSLGPDGLTLGGKGPVGTFAEPVLGSIITGGGFSSATLKDWNYQIKKFADETITLPSVPIGEVGRYAAVSSYFYLKMNGAIPDPQYSYLTIVTPSDGNYEFKYVLGQGPNTSTMINTEYILPLPDISLKQCPPLQIRTGDQGKGPGTAVISKMQVGTNSENAVIKYSRAIWITYSRIR